MKPVSLISSAIQQVQYHKVGETLDVLFHDGEMRAYTGVPWRVYQELIRSESPGGYFNAKIRDFYKFS